jgi:phosphatidate cytidylyltransferase
MQIRVLAGIPWLFGAILCLLLGEWPWAIFITMGAVVGVLEFYGMAHGRPEQAVAWVGAIATAAIMIGVQINQTPLWLGALLATGIAAYVVAFRRDRANAPKQAAMTVIGLFYVALPLATTEVLRREIGIFGVLLAIFITVGTDTFAYFGGRLWGKRPLAPRISPKKTVEGLYCGLIGGALLTGVLLAMWGGLNGAGLLIPLFGPPLAVIADLFESALKRHYSIKDSHLPGFNIIPGHGGVLDRADSLLLVAPFVAGMMALMGLL